MHQPGRVQGRCMSLLRGVGESLQFVTHPHVFEAGVSKKDFQSSTLEVLLQVLCGLKQGKKIISIP